MEKEKDSATKQHLRLLKKKGFAEADPTSDVEGHDAAYKLMILTRLAFGVNVALMK